MDRNPNVPHCSFCGKSKYAASKLLAAPGVVICDACVNDCNVIMSEEQPDWPWVQLAPAPLRPFPARPDVPAVAFRLPEQSQRAIGFTRSLEVAR